MRLIEAKYEPPIAAHWDGDVLALVIPHDPSSIHVTSGEGHSLKVYAPEVETIADAPEDETCRYLPDECGFTWRDEDGVEHHEELSASEDCSSASCDKCGFSMMVGDEGWFDGWDEIVEWTEEDGSEHKGYVLAPNFKVCPECGRRVVSDL